MNGCEIIKTVPDFLCAEKFYLQGPVRLAL